MNDSAPSHHSILTPLWLVTASEMRSLDQRTIQEAKVRGTVLMERAGIGVVHHLLDSYGPVKGKEVIIVCGKGNNGGDGLVVARHLKNKGARLSLIFLSSPKELSHDAAIMFQRLRKLKGIPRAIIQPTFSTLQAIGKKANLIIDAMLGTGLSSPIREPYESAIKAMNESPAYTVAVDIPSGLDSQTGHVLGQAVKADLTVTFGYPKVGLYVGNAIDHVGQVRLVDIGIPPRYIEDLRPTTQLMTREGVAGTLPERSASSHKGTFGHAGLIAGSPGKTGAPAMASLGALRVGTGLVTIATPQSVSPILEAKLLEAMTAPMPETPSHELSIEALAPLVSFSQNKRALAIGPGLGTSEETGTLLRRLLPQINVPCVLDADALTLMASSPEILTSMTYPPILTPHPGEMARLLGSSTPQAVNQDRIGVAKSFAQEHGVIMVLKGARTVIAEPGGQVAICPTGNPGMASAGMGDVLTGIISGLLAQGLTGWEAATSGVYIHGLAGDQAAESIGQPGLLARDVLQAIPQTLTLLLSCIGDR